MRQKQKGFSLIELLIVVAVLLIIAAFAIPNYMHSKMAANQASAVDSLRSLNTACVTYSVTYSQFPGALTNLGPVDSSDPGHGHGDGVSPPSSTSADLIDSTLAAGNKSGYTFVYTPATDAQSYTITATPITPATTGQNMYFTDQSGVIRVDTSGAGASAASTPIG